MLNVATKRSTIKAPDVALRILDFMVRTEWERQHLFRQHLQATVRSISPLLVDLAALEGVCLHDAYERILPSRDWPWHPPYDLRPLIFRGSRQRSLWSGMVGSRHEMRFERAFASPGVVIRKINHPNGRFAIRPSGSVMGFTASLGPCLLSAFGSTAWLKLPASLPEILMAAIPGRVLSEVVEHPLFSSRAYKVRRVSVDPADGLPLLTFEAKTVSFAGRWVPEAGSTE
jgi:hypothetical protein